MRGADLARRLGVCVLCAVACDGEGGPGDTVKLGVLLPFTGSTAAPSHNAERAVLFAAAQLGPVGVGGRPVEVIFGDTHSDVMRGVAAAQELLARGVVAILGPESDELATALLPELTARGVPLLSPGISVESPPGGAPQGGVWSAWPPRPGPWPRTWPSGCATRRSPRCSSS